MNVYIVHTVFRVNHDQHAINKYGELYIYIYIDVLLVHLKLDAALMPFVCGSWRYPHSVQVKYGNETRSFMSALHGL